jgi:hypothetical protein
MTTFASIGSDILNANVDAFDFLTDHETVTDKADVTVASQFDGFASVKDHSTLINRGNIIGDGGVFS